MQNIVVSMYLLFEYKTGSKNKEWMLYIFILEYFLGSMILQTKNKKKNK